MGFGGPSVEPPCGGRATILVRGVTKFGLGMHAGPATWTFGQTLYKARATMLVRGVPKWGFGGPSVEPPIGARATILVRGVTKLSLGTHAGPATWTFGTAPYGANATILVRGVPQ